MTGDLASHLWESTWFAVAAGLLTLVFRRNRARVRFALWLCASLKFLVPFALLTAAGAKLAAPDVVQPRVSIAVERIVATIAEPVTFIAPMPRSTDWTPAALSAVWVCGFLAIAVFRLRAWQRVRAALRASTTVEIEAEVEIRSAPGLLEPGVVGLVRPVLLLPDGIVDRLTPPQLATVLAHELCHVRRRDNWFAALQMIVEAMFWFHPLVWWIGARMVEERERACDEGVLSLGSEPREYAEAILGVCKLYVESPLVCVSGVTGADLKKRIEAIMDNRVGNGLTFAKRILLAGAGAAALAGPLIMGVIIGTGHAPALRAQRIPPPTAAPVQTMQNVPLTATPQRTVAPPAASQPQGRRMLTLFFDGGSMTSDEQSRARAAAIQFVQTRMQPGDVISVMQASSGKLRVVQDYTDDKALLQAAISDTGAAVEPSTASRLATLENAARMLGALPGKKALLYFAGGARLPGADDPAQLNRAIDAAVAANVAFYVIDARGDVSGAVPSGPGKLPVATYTGTPAVATTLVQAFDGQQTMPVHAAIIAGFAGRHAEFQTYPAGERQVLTVPLDGLSGRIDIVTEIRRAGSGDTAVAANLRDFVTIREPRPTGMYEAKFTLAAGSYTASLLVREQSTGRQFAETISFEVK